MPKKARSIRINTLTDEFGAEINFSEQKPRLVQ
jgi:hypothetical protein